MKNHNLKVNLKYSVTFFIFLSIAIQIIFFFSPLSAKEIVNLKIGKTLPDLSGLVWLKDDQFLGVHDSKNLKNDQPRVSLITLPQSAEGVSWKPLKIDWKSVGGLAIDLESITRIPETDLYILAESSNYQEHRGRLFLIQFKNSILEPLAVTNWSKTIENIEAIATTKIDNQLYFFYAERGAEKPNTNIYWTTLSLEPFKIGDCHATKFNTPDSTPNIRHISDMIISSSKNIYISSAFDPNQDNGPFKSSVWKIGKVELNQNNLPSINLATKPEAIAKIDGFKVESLAIRLIENQPQEIFIGTDDENYGGVIRLLVLPTKNNDLHAKTR